MATKSDILDCLKHGFPKESHSTQGYRISLEFQGPASILKPAKPEVGTQDWEGFSGIVDSADYEPLEGSPGKPEEGLLRVVLQENYDGGSGGLIGVARETSYEIEWVPVNRSIYLHPAFETGGQYALTDTQRQNVKDWVDETDSAVKANNQYYRRDKSGIATGSVQTLGASEIVLAALLRRGVESYDHYAPVVRKVTTYSGGIPIEGEAGYKDTPTGFPRLPRYKDKDDNFVSYEWLKTTDRAVREAKQTRWTRTEEWTGAKKVLLDQDDIFVP